LFQRIIIRNINLVSDSPKKAFYRLWLENCLGQYCVRKESGGQSNKTLNRRQWQFDSLPEAERFFDRKLREKTNPARKSPRKYRAEKS